MLDTTKAKQMMGSNTIDVTLGMLVLDMYMLIIDKLDDMLKGGEGRCGIIASIL
jgi:hypothetical protein